MKQLLSAYNLVFITQGIELTAASYLLATRKSNNVYDSERTLASHKAVEKEPKQQKASNYSRHRVQLCSYILRTLPRTTT